MLKIFDDEHMTIANYLVCWNPASEDSVASELDGKMTLIPWPDKVRNSDRWKIVDGACWSGVQQFSQWQRFKLVADIFRQAVFDGVNPEHADSVLSELTEWDFLEVRVGHDRQNHKPHRVK